MGPELLVASTIMSVGATGYSALAGRQAASKSARASLAAGMMEQQAANRYGTMLTSAAERSASGQELAANLEHEAALEMIEAQKRAVAYEIEAAGRKRAIAEGELKIGEFQEKAADFRADQLEDQGQLEQASASNRAIDVRHQRDLAISTIQAKAAASGGSASDGTIVHLQENIQERGELFALTEMFNGQTAKHSANLQAIAERMTGSAAVAEAIGRYEGTIEGARGDVMAALGRHDQASAGRLVADAQRARALAGADSTRSSAALQANQMRSSAAIDAYKAHAAGTIAKQQATASMFEKFGSTAGSLSKVKFG